MAGVVALMFMVFMALPALAVKGYLIEKTITTATPGGGVKEASEEKEYILPNASITETKLLQGIPGKRSRSTSIAIMTKEGIIIYDIDHDKKQYLRMVLPYDAFGSIAGEVTPNLFANLILCEKGKKCRINEKAFRFTGKKKKIGKWIAREVILVSGSAQGGGSNEATWVARDRTLEEASILYLKNFIDALKKSSTIAEDPKLLKFYTEGFEAFKEFIRKHGAPVMTVEEKMGTRIIETVKDVRKIDVSESMLRPPEDYTEVKLPFGMQMTQPGGKP